MQLNVTLMVISYPSRRESLFEAMALHFAKFVSDEFKLERCQDGDELVYLARTWKKKGYTIRRLDLYGHGAGGQFSLGDGLLFASDGTGYGVAKQLGPQLSHDGELRLLGCRTALVHRNYETNKILFSGPKLLRDLTQILGKQRPAWGSRGYIRTRNLSVGGGFAPETVAQFVTARPRKAG